MIDVLYVAFNRLEMTRESFTALLENTPWHIHATGLYVRDDGSTDGTAEYLLHACQAFQAAWPDLPVVFNGDDLGGPVASMNWYLDQRTEADRFAKIDNDFVVPPLWMDEMCRLLTDRPGLDILGIEPMHPPPVYGINPTRVTVDARHIGGKGIIRKRAFERCRPSPSGFNGYGGFTEWQLEHMQVSKAWVAPDIPAFGLDQLPFEPWVSLTREYAARGWARSWPVYPDDGTSDGYWNWWLEQDPTRREAPRERIGPRG